MKMFPLLLLACLTLAPPSARAETYHTCAGFIDSIPATIAWQGVWCLRHDVATAITSGNAITVTVNNVTIDCNGFKIGGLGGGPATQADGIHSSDRQNTVVRDCLVRGFWRGIVLSGGGHLVEDNRLDGNTFLGIYLAGDGSTLRRNLVFDTGGGTGTTMGYGIYTLYSVDVIDNSIVGVFPPDDAVEYDAFGIFTHQADGAISGNRIRNITAFGGGGSTFGIWNDASARVAIFSNVLVGDGSAGSTGVRCFTSNGVATGNVVTGFVTKVATCTDINNVP